MFLVNDKLVSRFYLSIICFNLKDKILKPVQTGLIRCVWCKCHSSIAFQLNMFQHCGFVMEANMNKSRVNLLSNNWSTFLHYFYGHVLFHAVTYCCIVIVLLNSYCVLSTALVYSTVRKSLAPTKTTFKKRSRDQCVLFFTLLLNIPINLNRIDTNNITVNSGGVFSTSVWVQCSCSVRQKPGLTPSVPQGMKSGAVQQKDQWSHTEKMPLNSA